MDSKKIIALLIILGIMVIIIMISILLLLNISKGYNNEIDKGAKEHIATPAIENDQIEIQQTLEKVTVRNNYYVVKNCVTKFFIYYSGMYNKEETNIIKDDEAIKSLQNETKKNAEAVYNILDEKYKNYKNITLDNLKVKLPSTNKITVDITDMYVSQKNENISIYFVYGYLIDTISLKTSKFSMIVNVDMLNRTYSVLLEDYIKENLEDIKIGKNIEISYSNKIEINKYNTFKYQAIADDTYITDIFNSFRDNFIYNTSEVYNNLEETYKQKKFKTKKIFNQYVEEKIKEISIMQLSKYQKTKYEDYTQYVCLTNNNKYYIINVFSPTEYKLILDTYTIDLPEFLEKYKSSDEKIKVGLNIQKIKEAINDNDFQYIYDKLDNTFKQNYYSNYNEFKDYLKLNLFNENTFKYKNIEKHGDVYVANIIINETKKMDIIMKLYDDTNFYISFNIE